MDVDPVATAESCSGLSADERISDLLLGPLTDGDSK
jgi:hypothetical protein